MKKLSFSLILLTFCYLLIEAFSYTAYRIKFGDYSLYNIQHSKLAAIDKLSTGGVFRQDSGKRDDRILKQILHPYAGFYVEGKVKNSDCDNKSEIECYSRIKVPSDFPLFRKSKDSLIVAILGGSFADGTARVAEQTFVTEFKKSALYQDKKVRIFNLANGAYKQPQQLMNLAFHYSLGAQFDIVINLDGFNEMAAGFLGYRDQGLHPSFPVFWGNRVSKTLNKEYVNQLADKRAIVKAHAGRANFWLWEGIRYSPLMNFVWQLLDEEHQRNISAIETNIIRLSSTTSRNTSYEATGPDYAFTNWQDFYDYVAQIWVNSSLSIRALAEGQGASYYHFLQPNQYIKGSKILSPIEKNKYVLKSGSYGNVFASSHSNIVNSAKQLSEKGVNYYDMTYVFKDVSKTLYVDNCCHLNRTGYNLIATRIVQNILDDKTK